MKIPSFNLASLIVVNFCIYIISQFVIILIECIDKVCHQTKFDTQWWQEYMPRIYQGFVHHTVFTCFYSYIQSWATSVAPSNSGQMLGCPRGTRSSNI